MSSRRLTDKQIIGAFVRQDNLEKTLGYRVDGSGNPRMGAVGTPGQYGQHWNTYGMPRVPSAPAMQGPLYVYTDPETGKTYQSYSNVSNTNVMQNLPDYKTLMEADRKEMREQAQRLEKSIPETPAKTRVFYPEDGVRIENSRRNPNQEIYVPEELKQEIEKTQRENMQLKREIMEIKKMLSGNNKVINRAPKKIHREE